MVAPTFGFSAGDFVAAVQILNEICKALKDAGGAASDYEETIRRLSQLSTILQRLEVGQAEQSSFDADDVIWDSARACCGHVQAFILSQEKYMQTIGSSANRWSPRTVYRRTQWALSTRKEVDKLWSKVEQDLATINLALSVNSL